MKLKKITVKNFRGLRGDQNIISFENSDIIFLIGQNNVGKSTFLRAYEYFVASKQIATRFDFNDHKEANEIEIIADFIKEEGDEEDTDFAGTSKDKDADWANKWVDANNLVKIKKVWSQIDKPSQKYTYDPVQALWVKGGFGGFDTFLTNRAPQLISISAMETETSLEDKVNKIINDKFLKQASELFKEKYDTAIEAIKELQKTILKTDDISSYNDQINKCFGEIFPHLILEIQPKQGDDINLTDVIKKNHSVAVKTDGATREETFIQQGHGVIRQALFNFLSFLGKLEVDGSKTKEYIILFEEPELFLHPKITYKLRKSLYELSQNSSYQVICATHSPLMIDISKPHASLVRVVKDRFENTNTYQVGDDVFQRDEYKNIVQMINRFNSHICECFYAEKVILVEGDTEAIVIRDLLERLYSKEDIFVLNTGSKNNIPFFQEVLTHFRITHYVFHDSDTADKKSAWTLNQNIWEGVTVANERQPGLSRRYIFTSNFETAHDYKENKALGKPLSAYIFAKENITSIVQDFECIKYLNDILGEQKIIHDDTYLQNLSLPANTKSAS